MPKSIQELRGQRNELSRQANDLLDKQGSKVWDKESQDQFDGLAVKMETLDKQISTTQRLLDLQAEESFSDASAQSDPEQGKNDVKAIYAKALRNGFDGLNQDDRLMIKNAMSTTTGSEGGHTIQGIVASELIETIKDYGGMRRVASMLTTSDGSPISYPTTDGTAEEGEWVAENQAATDLDISFGTRPLNVFKASSKVITVPFELLQDSQVDVVGLINRRFRDRLGRTMNKGFTVGTNSGQPNGCVTAATVGKVGASGQVDNIIYDDIIDLIESVDIAYDDGSLKFMFPQGLRKVLRKLKDTTGRPIWTPSYDAGIANRSPDQIAGYDTEINNDMPAPAANAKSLAFGQFKHYVIRDVMQLTLYRFEDSTFTRKGQVGFMAWMRAGGNLMDTSALKLYQHSAT